MNVEELIRKQVEAFNRHDPEGFTSYYDADAEVRDPQYPEPLRGTSAVRKDIAAWFSAFPDVEGKAIRTIASGDSYAAEWSLSGTHKAPLLMPDGSSVPATNKELAFTAALVGRIDARGRIIEEHRYYDLAGIMGQLGLTQ